ncbi:MIP18 family protein [Hibiscus syriacus]|uniref:MIP18 family protein n=1 Tax=Hibiscus syriacus TaxID=106335 RepID=A0A6A2ZZ98_HIBSY|nr:MIP18 family protein [Hibiscus syriacus]
MSEGEKAAKKRKKGEKKSGHNWREEVEERLIKKPKKRYTSWTEELNLDNLALLGPQWWVVRVARVRGLETDEVIARLLARNFPDIEFKIYTPTVQEKKKLKNGSISVKPKPLFPGCVFLRCVLNKEIHDFIREVDGVGGFVGSKAKEEQVKVDQAFEKEQQEENALMFDKTNLQYNVDSNDVTSSVLDPKPKRQTQKHSASGAKYSKLLVPGSKVRVLSGNFAEFVGSLKKLNRKTGKATVGFTVFGKESLVELDAKDIVLETK